MLSCTGGGGGGGQAVQASLSCPPPIWVSKKNYFAKFSHFKLHVSECEDVSIINTIQVKFSCFLCPIVLYA